jgi:predicted permease
MEVLNSLFTILIIVALGISSRKTNLFDKEHVKTLSSFVYYYGLPALFFTQISALNLATLDLHLITVSVLPIIAIITLLFLAKSLGWLNKDTFTVYSLSVAFGSHAFFGIAFFESLYDGKWLPQAIVTASALGLIGIPLSIGLFEYAAKDTKGLAFLGKIFKNPLIIAIFLGLLSAATGIRFDALNNALGTIGKTAGGIAIFSLGIFLYDNFSLDAAKSAVKQSLFRMLTLPLLTWALLAISHESAEMNQFLFLQSGIPAAVSLVVFAERYRYELPQITGMVLLTSILSFVELTGLALIAERLF